MRKEGRRYVFEDAKITFRNFAGRPHHIYNKNGERSFHLILTDEEARELEAEGFTIKWPTDDGYNDPKLKVKVRFGNYPPKIVQVENGNTTVLNETTVASLDAVEIEYIDLVINPSGWKAPDGTEGLSAYLKTIYVVLKSDVFVEKYGI